MNSPDPTAQHVVTFKEKVLNKRLLSEVYPVTAEALARADVDAMWDHMRNTLAFRLQTFVWQDPEHSHHREWRVTESASYESWRHHLIASLPVGCWRRRFLGYLWDIEPSYGGKQITHIIDVDVPAVLPEVQHEFPPSFGRIVFPIQITEYGASEPTQITDGTPVGPDGYWVDA